MSDQMLPTEREVENARVWKEVADRQAAEWAEAKALAREALGPGWTPWMKVSLVGPGGKKLAVAFKVYRGKRRLSEHARFVGRVGGEARSAGTAEELFADKEGSAYWSPLRLYKPRTAAQLARARVRRERARRAKEAEDNPLFADQVRSGAWRPGGKKS
jgi:hypothetical protein